MRNVMARPWTRAVLARLTGVNLETIRFYEQQELLPAPKRSAAGYRHYEDEHRLRLLFIRSAQQLGFTLSEIRELLSLKARRGAGSKRVKEIAEEKLASIEQKIRDLQQMRETLAAISAACDGTGSVERCPILRALSVSADAVGPKEQCHA